MKIRFAALSEYQKKDRGPRGSTRITNAEIYFEGDEPLSGLKLVGFKVWRNEETGEMYVTLPAHAYAGPGGFTKYSDFLRSSRGVYSDTDWLRDMILGEYESQGNR
jgi:hypothetical protein